MAQQLCLEGVRGPRLHNKSVNNLWSAHLIAESRPPDPLRTQHLRNFHIASLFYSFLAYLGEWTTLLTWTQGQMLDSSFLRAVASIPQAHFR